MMIAVECVITGRRDFLPPTTVGAAPSAVAAPTGCRVLCAPPHPHTHTHRRCPAPSLNLPHTRSDPRKSHHLFPFACCRQDDSNRAHLSAHCGGKKLFSNILHLPLFIPLPWRMPLTACKLIYNAVAPPRWVEDGRVRWGSILCVCGKVKDLSVVRH